jgi:hypothetical protein
MNYQKRIKKLIAERGKAQREAKELKARLLEVERKGQPAQPEPAQDTQAEPLDPIAEAHRRLKTDFISKLCGEGSMEPTGRYGPEVSIERRRY